ncbi:hypothetical protein CF326_g9495 [Tilletia indica]|nr:hypothetical protein CF326_g9495 [Tilletia indica]
MAGAPEGNGTAFLAEEINRFHRFLKLSRQEHIVTLVVYEHIQQVVNRVWGHSTEVSMFESRATALGTPSSDLDVHVGVAVTLSDNLTSSDRKALLVNKLYKVGEPSRDVANRRQIKAIPSLQAPLVRFSTKPEIGQMDVDISFGGDDGVTSSAISQMLCCKWPDTLALTTFLKALLHGLGFGPRGRWGKK